MSASSKMVKFDFPRIPILGTILLMIFLLNYYDVLSQIVLDKDEKYNIGIITALVIGLGTVGVSLSHLISMLFFKILFSTKEFFSVGKENYRTSYHWFKSIQDHSSNKTRLTNRDEDHNEEDRLNLKKLDKAQIHVTLNALELECRELNPSFGLQLEYYASLYIFFFISGIVLFSIVVTKVYYIDNLIITNPILILIDIILFCICFFGAFTARYLKDHLRIILFNHNRKFILLLLEKWYQCTINKNTTNCE